MLVFTEGQLHPRIREFRELGNSILMLNGLQLASDRENIKINAPCAGNYPFSGDMYCWKCNFRKCVQRGKEREERGESTHVRANYMSELWSNNNLRKN